MQEKISFCLKNSLNSDSGHAGFMSSTLTIVFICLEIVLQLITLHTSKNLQDLLAFDTRLIFPIIGLKLVTFQTTKNLLYLLSIDTKFFSQRKLSHSLADRQFPVAVNYYLVFSDKESDGQMRSKKSFCQKNSSNSESRHAGFMSSTLTSTCHSFAWNLH